MKLIDDDAREELAPIGSFTKVALPGTAFSPLNKPSSARYICVQALTQNIRYTVDGTVPTTAIGFVIAKDAAPIFIPLRTGTIPQFFPESAGAILSYQWSS